MRLLSKLSLLFLIIFSVSAYAKVELFVWRPTEGHVALILAKSESESADEAAKAYKNSFNKNRDLTELNEGKLNIKLDGFESLPKESSKPRILVLANDPFQFSGSANSKTWHRSLVKYGADVYVLPTNADIAMSPRKSTSFRNELVRNFDAILALGGRDIDPELYGSTNRHSKDVVPFVDQSEAKFIKAFLDSHKNSKLAAACFGICRGMQHTALILGYDLYQDIKGETGNLHNHRYDDHKIKIVGTKNSLFVKEFGQGELITTNSVHHQAVNYNSNPKGPLSLVAYQQSADDSDLIAEVMEFKSGLGFLVQFHPERMNNSVGRNVMRMMVDVASKVKKNRTKLAKTCRSRLSE